MPFERRMRAAYIEELGPAANICYGKLPTPAPGPTDVLVEVAATTVNPVDTFVRSGAFSTPTPFPFVVGRDAVGTVVEAYPAVTGFRSGEQVWCNSLGHAGRQGAAAQYAVVPAERCYRLPAGVDPGQAVAVLHPAATAYLALLVHGCLRSGESVYVAGGAGHVGSAAVLLARRAGARVVASASVDDHDYCRSLGADVVLDYRSADFADRLRAQGAFDVHLDTSGRGDLASAVDVLAPRGRIVVMASRSGPAELPANRFYTRDGRLLGFVISNATVAELAAAADRINQLLADGSLRPRKVELMPLAAMAEAHARLEQGRAGGIRLVLQP